MTCLIDVGGGFRDIYGAGVLDTCIEDNIEFDCCIAISAGSANIASFLAKQQGRNYRFFTDYSQRKETMSILNLIEGKHFLDLDYPYYELSKDDGEDPIDYETMSSYKGILNVVATNGTTGKATYFDKSNLALNNYEIIKASSSIPIVCGGTEIDGVKYFDGGIADPVPIRRAFELGCTKIVLILTKPKDYRASAFMDVRLAAFMDEFYPKCANALRIRSKKYNRGVELATKLEKEGLCLVVAPDDTCGVQILTRDNDKLNSLYLKGIEDGKKIKEFLDN